MRIFKKNAFYYNEKKKCLNNFNFNNVFMIFVKTKINKISQS